MSNGKLAVKPIITEYDSLDEKKGLQPVNNKTSRRLKIIEGQVRGIQRMVEEEKYCIDILDQVSAVRFALNSVGMVILKSHIENCVSEAIKDGGHRKSEIIDELMKLLLRNKL